MNIEAAVISNGLGATLMIMLLICAGNSIHRNDLAEKIFYAMIWATIGLCLFEAATFVEDGHIFPHSVLVSIIVNTCLFTTSMVFVYLWPIYVDYKMFGDKNRIKKIYSWLFIPAGVVLLMIFINLFTPVVFSISDANVYSRGKFISVPFLVSFFYLAYSEVIIYKNRSDSKRYLFLPSIIFILPILIGSLIQMFHYGISLTWACLAISMITIYINVQSETSSIDFLSGVFSRQYLDSFISSNADAIASSSGLAGIMMDLDRFKSINDTYGHLAGDNAITVFAGILRSTIPKDGIVVRYGGDEFIALVPISDESEVKKIISSIQHNLDLLNDSNTYEFDISFSSGYTFYIPKKDDEDAFIHRMDENMYTRKKEKSATMPDRRGL